MDFSNEAMEIAANDYRRMKELETEVAKYRNLLSASLLSGQFSATKLADKLGVSADSLHQYTRRARIRYGVPFVRKGGK